MGRGEQAMDDRVTNQQAQQGDTPAYFLDPRVMQEPERLHAALRNLGPEGGEELPEEIMALEGAAFFKALDEYLSQGQ